MHHAIESFVKDGTLHVFNPAHADSRDMANWVRIIQFPNNHMPWSTTDAIRHLTGSTTAVAPSHWPNPNETHAFKEQVTWTLTSH